MALKYKNIAIVGAGYWGKNLVRNFYKLGALKTVCDINKKILTNIKNFYPKVSTTTRISNLLNDPEIRALVIATPAVTHYHLVKRALLAGKDIFVEKPLSLNIKEAKELVRMARNKKLILMVGHLLLYHPAVIKLKRLISRGELGEILYIHSNRLNFGKLRREENVLWSFAPHDTSLIIDLMERLPKRVGSHGISRLNKGVVDTTLSYLEFKNNKAAHIFVSWLNPFKEQKLTVVGSKKMAVFDDQSKNKLVLYSHKVKWKNGKIPQAQKAKPQVIPIESAEPLRRECQHFLECIKKRKKPKTNGREALNVLKVLTACQKSLDNKGKIINLTK